MLGTTQPQVSALMRCKPTSISVGRLMEFLTILGQEVQVTVQVVPKIMPPRGQKFRVVESKLGTTRGRS